MDFDHQIQCEKKCIFIGFNQYWNNQSDSDWTLCMID